MSKTRKPLTPREQLKNLLHGLLDDDESRMPKKYKMTKRERAALEKVRQEVNSEEKADEFRKKAKDMYAAADALEARSQGKEISSDQSEKLVKALDFMVDAGDKYLTPAQQEEAFRLRTKVVREADETQWRDRTKKKNEPPGSGHVK